MNILTIDFDSLIKVDKEFVDKKFPLVRSYHPEDMKVSWKDSYKKFPEIREVDIDWVLLDYIKRVMREFDLYPCQYFEVYNHDHILDTIPEGVAGRMNIVNIDWHHDQFAIHEGNKVDPANWALPNIVYDKFKGISEYKYLWLCPNEEVLKEGKNPFTGMFFNREDYPKYKGFCSYLDQSNVKDDATLISNMFDGNDINSIVFCASPSWIPPHLLNKFREVSNIIFKEIRSEKDV